MRPSPSKRPLTNKGSFLWFLRQFHSTHLDPNLTFKIAKGEYGLEIHSRTSNLNSLKTELHGLGRLIPSQLQDSTHSQTRLDKSLQYCPSIIGIDGKKAILWGPLALVNHDCAAKIGFEFLDGEGEVQEGTDYQWGVKRREEAGKGGAVHVGKPVEVYYGPCKDEKDFLCQSCKNQIQ